MRDRGGETRPFFFENLSNNRGPARHLRRIFRHLEPFPRSPTFPRSCHRVVSSRPFQSTHGAIVRVTLGHSPPLLPVTENGVWLHSGKIIAAKSQFLAVDGVERCEPREESRGGIQGGPPFSPPPPLSRRKDGNKGEEGGKGRGQQKPRTLRASSLR